MCLYVTDWGINKSSILPCCCKIGPIVHHEPAECFVHGMELDGRVGEERQSERVEDLIRVVRTILRGPPTERRPTAEVVHVRG